MNLFEWAIIAFITGSILFHVWRGGARNPVGTGKLSQELRVVKEDVASLKAAAQGAATAADIKRLEREMKEKDDRITEVFDCLRKIDGDLDGLQKEVAGRLAGVEAAATATARQVDRLYDHIVTKGMG